MWLKNLDSQALALALARRTAELARHPQWLRMEQPAGALAGGRPPPPRGSCTLAGLGLVVPGVAPAVQAGECLPQTIRCTNPTFIACALSHTCVILTLKEVRDLPGTARCALLSPHSPPKHHYRIHLSPSTSFVCPGSLCK